MNVGSTEYTFLILLLHSIYSWYCYHIGTSQ